MRTIYFASSKGIGFTYHFSEFAASLKSNETLFISGEMEQFPGIFKKLDQANVRRVNITALDTSKKILSHIVQLIRIVKQFKPELIHSQTNYQLLLAVILKPFFNYKIIQTIHAFNNGESGIKTRLTTLYIVFMCGIFVDKVIFQSKYVEDNFPKLKYKSCRLPMGFKGPDQTVSKILNHPVGIIYAAKFHSAKNHRWLIDTLGLHLKNNDWRLILPGDGAQLDTIRELVKANGLDEWVDLPGWVDRAEMDRLYKMAHLAVVPSKSETLGHNIIEPLAYGLPVISFPVGIAPDIAGESPVVSCTGFYDKESMLDSIREKLSASESYHKLSIAALDYFNKHLTWDAHIIQYKNILNEL